MHTKSEMMTASMIIPVLESPDYSSSISDTGLTFSGSVIYGSVVFVLSVVCDDSFG